MNHPRLPVAKVTRIQVTLASFRLHMILKPLRRPSK